MARLPTGVKKKATYRVAVLGCGKIGALFEAEPKREKPASHAGAVSANKKTKLVALMDTNLKNLAAANKLFPSATRYSSLAECLKNEHPDIAVLATPPNVRFVVLKEIIRSGVSIVICEKPLALSVREAEQIEALVAKSGTTFVLNYQRRFAPLFTRVRDAIAKGKLGRIQQVTGYYSNGLYNNGGHIVDSLAYLLDDDIVAVIGLKNRVNMTHPPGDINVDATLVTKKGTNIVLQSFDQHEYGIHDIRIYGTKGSVVLTDYSKMLIEDSVRPSRFVGMRQLDASRARISLVPFSNTAGALAHAVECFERRRASRSSAINGLAVVRVLDAVAKSSKHGGAKILV